MESNKVSATVSVPPVEAPLYIRCKVCGFILKSSALKDYCPACGVKAAMFEPVTEKFSVSRRRFLDLHIHPILSHFPQAFSVTILLSCLGLTAFSGPFKQTLIASITLLSCSMPGVLIITFLSGLKDGTVRFKKLSTPFLRLKMILGIAYLVISVFNCVFAILYQHGANFALVPLIACAVGLVVFTTILGNIGAQLACSRMPG